MVLDDMERLVVRQLYELQSELFKQQGDQMAGMSITMTGLGQAIAALQKSHETLGRLLAATAKFAGFG